MCSLINGRKKLLVSISTLTSQQLNTFCLQEVCPSMCNSKHFYVRTKTKVMHATIKGAVKNSRYNEQLPRN